MIATTATRAGAPRATAACIVAVRASVSRSTGPRDCAVSAAAAAVMAAEVAEAAEAAEAAKVLEAVSMRPCPTEALDREAMRVAVAATFAAEGLAEPLRVWAEAVVGGPKVDFTWVGYGQALEALSAGGALTTGSSVAVLLARLSDFLRLGTAPDVEAAADVILAAVTASRYVSGAAPLLLLLPPEAPGGESSGEAGVREGVARARLEVELAGLPGVHVVGGEALWKSYGAWLGDACYCAFLDRAAHAPYSALMCSVLAGTITRQLARSNAPVRKVVVLDCDGTLWGGAVGELGPAGVELSVPFIDAQQFYVDLQKRGFLLCLCSRNLEADVRAVFEARAGEMPLNLSEHIVGLRVNWSRKSDNIASLAQDLCLALDSFVFVDDNAAECAEVQAQCLGVTVLHLPACPDAIPSYLRNAWCFDAPLAAAGAAAGGRTREDAERSELYRALLVRRAEQTRAASEDAFLASLNLRVDVRPLDAATLERAAQLTQRTNQHNTHKVAMSSAKLQELLDGGLRALVVESADRFGHHGVVGLIGIEPLTTALSSQPIVADDLDESECCLGIKVITEHPDGSSMRCVGWLLSCRTLHLGIEYRMLWHVAALAAERGATWLAFDWIRAERNEPAAAFFFFLAWCLLFAMAFRTACHVGSLLRECRDGGVRGECRRATTRWRHREFALAQRAT